jgi:hypothetical protein
MFVFMNWTHKILQRMGLHRPKPYHEPLPLKIGELSFTIPQSWQHITTEQYIRLKDWNANRADDSVEWLAIMLNVDTELIGNCRTIDLDIKIAPLLAWATKPYDLTLLERISPPATLKLGGVEYERPTSIGPKTYGMRVMLDNVIRAAVRDKRSIDTITADIVAIVFADQVAGKFSPAAVEQTKELVLASPFKDTYPLAAFFWKRYVNWLLGRKGSQSRTAQKKSGQASTRGSNASATSTQ